QDLRRGRTKRRMSHYLLDQSSPHAQAQFRHRTPRLQARRAFVQRSEAVWSAFLASTTRTKILLWFVGRAGLLASVSPSAKRHSWFPASAAAPLQRQLA